MYLVDIYVLNEQQIEDIKTSDMMNKEPDIDYDEAQLDKAGFNPMFVMATVPIGGGKTVIMLPDDSFVSPLSAAEIVNIFKGQ